MRCLISLLLCLAARGEVLHVTILDHVGVPAETLEGAREFLSGVFGPAGTRLEIRVERSAWRRGQTMRLEDVTGDVVLRICSREMAKVMVPKSAVFGYVQPWRAEELPRVANVFYHRIGELEEITDSSTARILGAVLAHEMGHLLMGRGAHSAMGIMRCPWDTAELRDLARGTLVFDRQQRISIADGVRQRRAISR